MRPHVGAKRIRSSGPGFQIWALPFLLLGWVLQLFRITGPSLRGDEGFSWMVARMDVGAILRFIWEAREPHSPLPFLWMKAWMLGAGDSELTLRFHSAFATFLILPLAGVWLYWITRKPLMGAMGIALVGMHPYIIWLAQDARPYGTLAFWGLFQSMILWRALRANRLQGWIAYGLASALALYYHYAMLFVLPLQGMLTLLLWRHRWRGWILSAIAIGIMWAPGAVLAYHALAPYRGTALQAPPPADAAAQVLRVFTVGWTGDGWPARLAVGGALILAGSAVFRLLRRSRKTGIWMLGHLSVPILATWLASQGRAVFAPHYMAAGLPFWITLIALGGWGLSALRPSWLQVIPWWMLAVGFAQSLWHHYALPQYAKSPPVRELVSFLRQKAAPGDHILITFPDPVFPYYYRGDIPWSMLPATQPFHPEEVQERLKELAQRHPRIWLLPVHLPSWPGSEEVERWLVRHADLLEVYPFGVLRLMAFRPLPWALQGMQRKEARWADGVELLGVRVEPTHPSHPGGLLRISTAWRRWGAAPQEHSVFVHLVDGEGRLVAQDDHPVGRGEYPPWAWEPDEVVFERFELRLPAEIPPGRYLLRMGRYNWETLIRVPVGDQDFIEISTVEVLP
jgi:hypothetical protein